MIIRPSHSLGAGILSGASRLRRAVLPTRPTKFRFSRGWPTGEQTGLVVGSFISLFHLASVGSLQTAKEANGVWKVTALDVTSITVESTDYSPAGTKWPGSLSGFSLNLAYGATAGALTNHTATEVVTTITAVDAPGLDTSLLEHAWRFNGNADGITLVGGVTATVNGVSGVTGSDNPLGGVGSRSYYQIDADATGVQERWSASGWTMHAMFSQISTASGFLVGWSYAGSSQVFWRATSNLIWPMAYGWNSGGSITRTFGVGYKLYSLTYDGATLRGYENGVERWTQAQARIAVTGTTNTLDLAGAGSNIINLATYGQGDFQTTAQVLEQARRCGVAA